MARPQFRITCCLCGKLAPLSRDLYLLDQEWRRRNPTMVGNLACRCALTDARGWVCVQGGGGYPPGHIRRPGNAPDIDHWSHVTANGTHVGMVLADLESGMTQGAAEYIRHTAARKGVHPDAAARLRAFLEDWDRRHVTPPAG